MLANIKPLPRGVSGKIKVLDFKVALHGSTAVTAHLDDEYETYHGHELHCEYRTTDTWVKTNAGRRIIAGQVLALRTDPPAVTLTPRQMDEYTGRYALTPGIIYEIRRVNAPTASRKHCRPRCRTCYLPAANLATGKYFYAGQVAGPTVLQSGARPGILSGHGCRSGVEGLR